MLLQASADTSLTTVGYMAELRIKVREGRVAFGQEEQQSPSARGVDTRKRGERGPPMRSVVDRRAKFCRMGSQRNTATEEEKKL